MRHHKYIAQGEQNQTKYLRYLQALLLYSKSSAYSIFLLFCIVFAVTVFASTLNGIAPSAISREGKSFNIMKQIPVPFKTQLKAKRNAALIICWIGSGGYLFIGEFLLILFVGLPWWSIFPSIIFNLLLLYIIIDLKMMYILFKPSLSWESVG